MAKAVSKPDERSEKQQQQLATHLTVATDSSNVSNVSSAKKLILISAGLFVLVMAVWFPALNNDFLSWYCDDPLYVTENPHVNSGLTAENLRWAFTSMERSNWHPLTWISHMLDCQIYGLKPWGHHLTNVLLHAANAVLLFLLLQQMTGFRRSEVAENVVTQAQATWGSFAVAVLFAIHPLRVESVAWISERKDVLSAFFGLLAIWFYVGYAQRRDRKGAEVKRGKGERSNPLFSFSPFLLFYLLSLLFFACGLMSKATVVTLPFVLLLLDYWPLRRVTGDGWRVMGSETPHPSRFMFHVSRLVLEKIPFFALTVAASAMTYMTQNKWSVLRTLNDYPLDARVGNALVSYGRYLGQMFWPVQLCGFYPHPGRWALTIVLPIALLLAVLTFVCVRQYKRRPYLIVGWLWFLGVLVPTIGLVQTCDQALADRFTYIPMIGVLLCIVWLTFEWVGRLRRQGLVCALLLVAVCFPLIAATRQHISHYKDGSTVWRRNLEVTGDNGLARYALGLCLDKKGETKEAIKEMEHFLKLYPDQVDARFNLANMYQNQRRTDEAIAQFFEALRRQPRLLDARKNLATLLVYKGRVDEAAIQFREILRHSNDPNMHNDLGTIIAPKGQLDEAIAHFRAALKVKPDHAAAHSNLGGALCEKGLFDEAIPHLQEALRLNPADAQARKDLDAVLSRKK